MACQFLYHAHNSLMDISCNFSTNFLWLVGLELCVSTNIETLWRCIIEPLLFITMQWQAWVYYAQIFFHAIAIVPMQVLLLCSNYAQITLTSNYAYFKLCSFIVKKHLRTRRGTNIPPTGIRLFLLFILTAVTDGQNVTVLMLVDVAVWLVSLSLGSWVCLMYCCHTTIAHVPCGMCFGSPILCSA